jgi:hypothetical protein
MAFRRGTDSNAMINSSRKLVGRCGQPVLTDASGDYATHICETPCQLTRPAAGAAVTGVPTTLSFLLSTVLLSDRHRRAAEMGIRYRFPVVSPRALLHPPHHHDSAADHPINYLETTLPRQAMPTLPIFNINAGRSLYI